MVGIYALISRARLGVGMTAATACALVLAAAAPVAAAPTVGTFQKRAASPKPVNNVAVDPTTNMIYAQQYGNTATGFYRYNPRTNQWKTLTSALIPQGNNGGAAYIKGKIYTVYTENNTQMGVYDIKTDTWSTITNPLGRGTGDITAVGNLLYLVSGNNFISYNPATNSTHTLAAPPFSFTSWGGLAPYKGKIYGQQGDGDTGFAVYDIATNKWKKLRRIINSAVLGAAIDPVAGVFYAYGGYGGGEFYRYNIKSGRWLRGLYFPSSDLDDGGMAYISKKGLQGIYAVYGQESNGFTRYVTPPRH